MKKIWLVLGACAALHATSIVCSAANNVVVEDKYARIGKDEFGNYYLVIYYREDVQPIDDRETTLKIAANEYPLQEGQTITNQSKYNLVTANYENGVLHVKNHYRRKCDDKKYPYRAVNWTYSVRADSDLTRDSLAVIKGLYSHAPSN